MSKPEWGAKRVCINCSTRFYDLKKKPIVCPECSSTFDPEAFMKPKRGRLNAEEKRMREENIMEVNVEEGLLIEDAVLEEVSMDGDELIEDTSELDTEGDDVIDVIEGVESGVIEEE